MGCHQSKATDAVKPEEIPREQPAQEGKVLMGSTVQKGTPFVTKRRPHADPAVVMCPYFKVAPEQFETWKKSCDLFYSAAKEASELLFYGMAFNDGGVHIQQGFGSADALLAHLRRADIPMTEALKSSTLEKVEVYGSKRQLLKVKRSMTKIGDCMFQFFETTPKVKGIRRPTEFSGEAGSDKLVTCHVSIQFTSVEALKVLKPKIKAVHRRAIDSAGSESFCATVSMYERTIKMVSTHDSMDATVEHLASVVSHLGVDAVSGLQIHGPDSEVDKLKALMGTAAASAEAAASMLKAALESAAKRAAEDAKHTKACVAAAAKAVANGVTDAVKAARDKTVATVEELQKKAEENSREAYKTAMKTAGSTKEAAKASAQKAYRQAMDAVNDMRQSADEEAAKAYEAAMAAGASVEKALEAADKAAEAGAKAMHDELCEVAEAAELAAKAAADAAKAAGEDVAAAALEAAKLAQEEYEASKLAAELGALAVEAQAAEAAKEARRAMMTMYEALKKDAQEAVNELYTMEREAKQVTEETVQVVVDRARAASWAVILTSEDVYLVGYEKALAAGKAAVAAREAADEAAKSAASKVHDLWKREEQLAMDAVASAENMVKEGEKAVVKVWDSTVTYTLDTQRAVRCSLSMAGAQLLGEIQEATDSVAYAEGVVVAEVAESLDEAEQSIFSRIQDWYDTLIEMEVNALRAVADTADAKAETVERKQKVCC